MVEIGAYRSGTNPELDRAISLMPRLEAFLRQDIDKSERRADSMKKLQALLA